jgi:L-malate glycosyltransferase
MKIAILSPISADMLDPIKSAGIETPASHRWGMNADLVNGLLAKGHHVDVITTAPGSKKKFYWKTDNFSLTMVPCRFRISAYTFYIRPIAKMRQALKSMGPYDIVHSHWLYEYTLGAKAGMGPILVTVQDWPLQILKFQKSYLRFCKFLMSLAARNVSDFATAPSPYMAKITERLGFKTVAIIPNATPGKLISAKSNVIQLNGTPKLVAINIGFDERKNVSSLIVAFSKVLIEIPEARLRLIGPQYEKGGAAELFAKSKGMTKNIDFMGQMSRAEILVEISHATLFVHPSLEESFGVVLIEAMSQGVPVLGGKNSGAVPWVLDGGKAGILTDVSDPEVFAQDIARALGNLDVLNQIASAGQNRVRKEFTSEIMVEKYEQEYIRIHSLEIQKSRK